MSALKQPVETAPRDGAWFHGWFRATEMTNASHRRVRFDAEVGEFYDSYKQLVRGFYAWSAIPVKRAA